MAAIVFLIEQIALGLYVFIGLGIIWYLRKFAAEQGAMRSSGFELERELARFRRANAVMFLVVLVEAGLIVFGVQTVVAPYVRAQVDTSLAAAQVMEDLTFNTPTPALLAPVNIDSSGIEFEPTDPASVIRITPTPTETPPGTIEPNAPVAIGCDTDNATLRVPRNGQVVHQVVEVIGTAYVDNFAFYKLEISGPSTNGQYGTIEQLTQPVTTTGRLSQFNPIAFEEGWYLYRVGVFNNTGQLAASCAVNIYIRPPIPTSTPIVQN